MRTYFPKWNPKMPIIVGLIHTLYDEAECSSGGLCHIVTDDDNLNDHSLKFVIDYCKRPENADSIDVELSSWICELMLQLDLEQRAGLFGLMRAGFDMIDESVWKLIPNHPEVQLYISEVLEEE